MTKIHPEAVALLNKHRGTTFRPGGEHYVENLTATEAISQAIFERDEARAKASHLTTLLDQQLGHPCEQIRHGYEVEALRAQVAEMREALTAVEQWWLDMGMRHLDGAPTAIYRVREILSKDNSND